MANALALCLLIVVEAICLEGIMELEPIIKLRNAFWGDLKKIFKWMPKGYIKLQTQSGDIPVCSQINQTVSVIALLLCWMLVFIKLLTQNLRELHKPWDRAVALVQAVARCVVILVLWLLVLVWMNSALKFSNPLRRFDTAPRVGVISLP